MEKSEMIKTAIDIAIRYGGIDGDHHKSWVIDQMVRALTDCPKIPVTRKDINGIQYIYESYGESDQYKLLVAEARNGEDGPDTYDWNVGIAP